MNKPYPNLLHALGGENGFDPMNPSVQKLMRSLLSKLNYLPSTTYQLYVTELSNNKMISYVKVPRTASDRSFLNSKEWVDYAIQISGSKNNGTFESAYRIANHILRYYQDSFSPACEMQGVSICKPMMAMEFQGMISAAGLSGTSEKELKKRLGAHLRKGSAPPDAASACCPRAILKSTMAKSSSPMIKKRRQRLLSGQKSKLTRRFASTYSVISMPNPSHLLMLKVCKLSWEETMETPPP